MEPEVATQRYLFFAVRRDSWQHKSGRSVRRIDYEHKKPIFWLHKK